MEATLVMVGALVFAGALILLAHPSPQRLGRREWF